MKRKSKSKSVTTLRLPPTEGSRISVHLKTKVRRALVAAGVHLAPYTRDGDLIGAMVTELRRRLTEPTGDIPADPASFEISQSGAGTGTGSNKLMPVASPVAQLSAWLTSQEEVARGCAFINPEAPLYFYAESGQPRMPQTSYVTMSRTVNILFVSGEPMPNELAEAVAHRNPMQESFCLHKGSTFQGWLDVFTAPAFRVNELDSRKTVARIDLDNHARVWVYLLKEAHCSIDMIVVLDFNIHRPISTY